MTITALPNPPRRSDGPTPFADNGDVFLAALPTFVTEANALATELNAATTTASDAAISATAQVALAVAQVALADAAAADAAADAVATAADRVQTGLDAAAADASRIAASKLNLGNFATAPTLDNQGAALLAGATYYDTSMGKWRVYSGSAWADGISVTSGVSSINTLTGALSLKTINGESLLGTGNIGEFPSGTVMLFAQTAAPTGWTKSTTHNDKALRVVSGTAGSGGSVAFTTAFASKTPAGTVSGSVGTTGATTLSTTQMPAHTHGFTAGGGGTSASAGVTNYLDAGGEWRTTSQYSVINTVLIKSEGGGGSHTHTGGSLTASFTGTAMNFAVQYVDVIIATKD